MQSLRLRHTQYYCATFILAVALLLQAIIPQGFMPDFESEDAFTLSICRSSDLISQPNEIPQDHQNDKFCAFMVAASGDNHSITLLSVPEIWPIAINWLWEHDRLHLHAPYKYWQAQAPPYYS